MNKKIIAIEIISIFLLTNLATITTTSITTDDNQPPTPPIIDGAKTVKPSLTEYTDFTFCSTDPDGDQLYYTVCWSDEGSFIQYGIFGEGEQ